MAVKNAYELLQVFPGAAANEIKDAFRFLLFRYHPDHNKGREEWAVQRTMELVEAYHILSDPAKRAHHDVMRAVRIKEERGRKGLFGGGEKGKLADEEFKRGLDAWKADEYEQAIKRFARVIELDKDCANARFNLAACFLALEKVPECISWLQEYLGKAKDDPETKSLLGKVTALTHRKGAN